MVGMVFAIWNICIFHLRISEYWKTRRRKERRELQGNKASTDKDEVNPYVAVEAELLFILQNKIKLFWEASRTEYSETRIKSG